MRILMHAPTDLLKAHGHFEAMRNNLINSNHGELLFPYSLSRALMLDSVEIDYYNFLIGNIDLDPAKVNEDYDFVLLPFANLFRPAVATRLALVTEFLKKVTVPVVVPCIGWQGKLNQEPESGLSSDDVNREFCKVVLERSSAMGVRGETTGRYLAHLGFKAEQDFMVLGCPSMYMFGDSLPAPKPLELTHDSRININNKLSLPYKVHRFMRTVAEEYPNSYYIPQNHYELKLLYSGVPLAYSFNAKIKHPKHFPIDLSDDLYTQDRVRGFVDVPSWFEFLKQGELNFGTRIHGNIAGVLSGNPTFIVACDARVDELASYHNIAHTTLDKLPADATLEQLVGEIDFGQVQRGHKERFERYLGFLHKAGFETVFDKGAAELTCFDRAVAELQFPGPIVTLAAAPPDTLDDRMLIWRQSMKNYQRRKAVNPAAGEIDWQRDEREQKRLEKPALADAQPSQKKRNLLRRLSFR